MIVQRLGAPGAIGENIFAETRANAAFDPGGFAKRASDAWMASPQHRGNVLSPNFTATGIGVAFSKDRAYATEVFYAPPKKRS